MNILKFEIYFYKKRVKMKNVLLVGILAIMFFQNLQSASSLFRSTQQSTYYSAGIVNGLVVAAKLNMENVHQHSIAGMISRVLPQLHGTSSIVITLDVLTVNPVLKKFLIINGFLNMLVTLYGDSSSETNINKVLIKKLIDDNQADSAYLYELVLNQDSTFVDRALTYQEKAELVDLLLLFYENQEKLDEFVKQVKKAKNDREVEKSIQEMVVSLHTRVSKKIVEQILSVVVLAQKIIKQSQVSKDGFYMVDVGSNVQILTIQKQALLNQRQASKSLSMKEQSELLANIAEMFGVESSVTLAEQLAKVIDKNRKAAENIIMQAAEELKKNPKANVVSIIEKIVPKDSVLPSMNFGYQHQSLTDAFLETVRDLCMPKALELVGLNLSNTEKIDVFQQDFLNEKVNYNQDERAYMLGYFQSCLWQLQKRSGK